MKWGVIFPMQEEATYFYSKLKNKDEYRHGTHDLTAGTIGINNIIATVCGMGHVNAALATQMLVERGVEALLVVGCCGAITDLEIGSIVCPKAACYHTSEVELIAKSQPFSGSFPTTSAFTQRLMESAEALNLKTSGGIIASNDMFVNSEDQRQAIVKATQATTVDMESAAVGHVAARNHVNFAVLRVVSDNANTHFADIDMSVLQNAGKVAEKFFEASFS